MRRKQSFAVWMVMEAAQKNEASAAQAATGFLKAQAPLAGRFIRLSSALALGNGLLILAGAWCLAQAVDGVMFRQWGMVEVIPYLVALAGIYLVRAVLIAAAEHYGARAALTIKRQLRQQLTARLFSPPISLDTRAQTGAIVSVLAEGVDALHAYYARYLPAMGVTVFLPLTILCFVFPVDWVSGVILLVTAPLIPFFMILIGRGAERLNQRQWRRLAFLGGHFLDVIQGLTTLKLFNASQREAQMVRRMCETYRHDTMAVLRVVFLSSLALEFFATVSIALVAVLVGFRLLWEHVPFDNAYLVLLLAPEFYLPLRRMGAHYHARMEAIGAAEKVVALLEQLPTVAEREKHISPLCMTPPRIVFRNVSFAYEAARPVLRDVSFTVEPGERLALTGVSGSGKSTIIALLLGLVQPDNGEILVNDTPLHTLPLEAWRASLGWVPQAPTLFTGTVLDNIRLGHPTADDATCAALAQELGIDFLHQPVREQGRGLSGGQVQRVAVARALLRAAPLLVLDEPTASLDAESESLIAAALARRHGQCTMITAAHRLHTLAGYEHTLHLDDERGVG